MPGRGMSLQGRSNRLEAPHRLFRSVGHATRRDRRSGGRPGAGLAPSDPPLLGRLTFLGGDCQTTEEQSNTRPTNRRTTEEQSNMPLPERPTANADGRFDSWPGSSGWAWYRLAERGFLPEVQPEDLGRGRARSARPKAPGASVTRDVPVSIRSPPTRISGVLCAEGHTTGHVA